MGLKQRTWFFGTLGATLLLGLGLQWPSLDGGFRGDDYVQWAMARGDFPSPRSSFDLFSFAAGTPQDYRRLVEFGHLPWWSHPELRLRMWRPLASGLMALDFRLWGTDARLHHVHSLLWFGLLLLAAGRVLWRVLPPRPAALAWLMFASAPCHTLPVGWLANRSTLIACSLGFAALELQLRARDKPSIALKLGCACVTALALLSGEYALSTLVYGLCLIALPPREVSRTETPTSRLRGRLRQGWPVLAPLCAYLALHSLVGSDIVHSGYYISPLRAPVAFLRAAASRVPVLAADLLYGMPSLYYHAGSPLRGWLLSLSLIPPEVWVRLPNWTTWHTLIGYTALAGGTALHLFLRGRLGRQRPPDWLALGAVLSLIPCAGSLPEDRLLTSATLGTSALVASALVYGLDACRWPLPRRARVAWTAAWLCAAWVPLSAVLRSHDDVRSVRLGSEVARAWCLAAELPTVTAPDTRVYLLSTADFNTAVNLPWLRLLEAGAPLPRSYRRLGTGPMPLRVKRESDRVLELRVLSGDVYGSAVPSLYRDAASAVLVGEHHVLEGLSVHVLETYMENPTRVRFEFDRSLDDPALWLVASTEWGVRRITAPPVGQDMLIPFAQYRDVRTK